MMRLTHGIRVWRQHVYSAQEAYLFLKGLGVVLGDGLGQLLNGVHACRVSKT